MIVITILVKLTEDGSMLKALGSASLGTLAWFSPEFIDSLDIILVWISKLFAVVAWTATIILAVLRGKQIIRQEKDASKKKS